MGMFFCFFKQKTAYEMRISDWSSDVCSSDLDGEYVARHGHGYSRFQHAEHGIILVLPLADGLVPGAIHGWGDAPAAAFLFPLIGVVLAPVYPTIISEIGRASCRERVCQYV